MKNSMLLIFLAIGGVIAYMVLGKKQPASQGTNTILGSTGGAQPAVTQNKAGKQRTDNTAAYLQAGAGLLASLVGGSKSGSGVSGGISYNGKYPFLPFGGRDDSSAKQDTGVGLTQNLNILRESFGPFPSDNISSQYASPIGPSFPSFDSPDSGYLDSLYTDTSSVQSSDSNSYADYSGD